jgi:uncharacterized protein YlxW (UPF0749 family)
MDTPDGPTPPEGRRTRLRRLARRPWPWLAIGSFALAGGLFITSGLDARGADLRAASVTDLSTLVRGQRTDTDALRTRVAALNTEVNTLSRGVGDRTVNRLQRTIDDLRGPSGLSPVSGPGVTVTLQDAPQDVLDRAIQDGEPPGDTLVVHQQDIQAVVNALWLGGATAITIMDQRIISTTGIKCAGPTVILHGVPFSPPYRIKAVGDPASLLASLDGSDYIDAYRTVADTYGLGYAVTSSANLDLPGYEGTLELRYAKPLAAQ